MTIMARTRSLSSIETEISKVTAELQKAQEKVDELTQRLLELQEQKQSIEVKQIMDAFRRSGKSMHEYSTHLVRSFRGFGAGHPEIRCSDSGCQCSPL